MDWETESNWGEYEILEDWREQLDEVRDTADDWRDADDRDDSDREVLGEFFRGLPSVVADRHARLEVLTGLRVADIRYLEDEDRVPSPVAEWNRVATASGLAGSDAWALVYVSSLQHESAPRPVVACSACVAAIGPAAIATGRPAARWTPVLVDWAGVPSQRWPDGAEWDVRDGHPATATSAGAPPHLQHARPCDVCGRLDTINVGPFGLDAHGSIATARGSELARTFLNYVEQLANLREDSSALAGYESSRLRQQLMRAPGIVDDPDRVDVVDGGFLYHGVRRARLAWLGSAALIDADVLYLERGTGGGAPNAYERRVADHWMSDEEAWNVSDTEVLETCCGDLVEWDCPTCPDCGSQNPLRAIGVI